MTESLRERAEAATKEVQDILGGPADSDPKKLAEAIERAITNALLEERKQCAETASKCLSEYGENEDMAAEDINRINTALIANLSAMR